MSKKQPTKTGPAAAGMPKNDLEAMWRVVDAWTRPGARVPASRALKMLDELDEILEKAFKVFENEAEPLEVRLHACELVRVIVDFKLSLATGRRELNIVPDLGYVTKTGELSASK